MKAEFSTPYSRAWKTFKESDDFEDAVDFHSLDGAIDENQKYLENRLRVAFDAGWNLKTSSILEAIQQTAGAKK